MMKTRIHSIFLWIAALSISASCNLFASTAAQPTHTPFSAHKTSSPSTAPKQTETITQVPQDSIEFPSPSSSPPPSPVLIPEQPVQLIPLAGPIASPEAEVSGMAWYRDYLIILPQYPMRFARLGSEGSIFALSKGQILAYLDGSSTAPLEPIQIAFYAPPPDFRIVGFEGFEAIAFDGDRIILTIESRNGDPMMGYLESGTIASDLSAIHMDPASLIAILPQTTFINMTDEAALVVDGQVLTFYEANGSVANPSPVAHRVNIQTNTLDSVPMYNLEYRLTDATPTDPGGRFWVIDLFWLGEFWLLPAFDALATEFGLGATHSQTSQVERLVELEYTGEAVTLSGNPPIYLQLQPGGEIRNWEAIARLEQRGYLLMTDKFPETLLAFVPSP